MKTKLILASFTFWLLGNSPVLAGENLCKDAVKAVCSNQDDPVERKVLIERIVNQASKQTQEFLNERPVPVKEFLTSVPLEISEATNEAQIQSAVARGLSYISCLDYLARNYFDSEGNYGTSLIQCFPKGPFFGSKTALHAAIARMEDVSAQKRTVSVFKEIRDLTQTVIQQSNYPHAIKPKLMAAVARTEYISTQSYAILLLDNFSQYLQNNPNAETHLSAQLSQILYWCDPFGAAPNAANRVTWVDPKIAPVYAQNYMVICPAMWILSTRHPYRKIGDENSSRDRLTVARDALYVKPPVLAEREVSGDPDRMVAIIAHELAHSVDQLLSSWQGSAKENKNPDEEEFLGNRSVEAFTACIKKRHVVPGFLTATPELFSSMKAFTPGQVAHMFFHEYHADSVSANVQSLYLKRYPDLEQRRKITVNNLKVFCGSQQEIPKKGDEEGLHPVGEFRIQNSFLGNLNLRKTLGCSELPRVVGCSFR